MNIFTESGHQNIRYLISHADEILIVSKNVQTNVLNGIVVIDLEPVVRRTVQISIFLNRIQYLFNT